MNENSDVNDFRTTRYRLPPEAFAWGPEEPDPAPEDLVEERIWESMISLPDDVSLRTSDNHGSQLRAMYELWASWIQSVGEEQDAVWYVMLDVGDEFQACLFNSLCGFYRVAASCLRSALELTVIGTFSQLQLGLSELLEWKEGKREVKFGTACDCLINHPGTSRLEDHLKTKVDLSIFGQRSPGNPEGWARELYDRLSDFTHSRPSHSLGMMWQGSNGPIYVSGSFGRVYRLYLETIALGYVLVKLARPSFQLPRIWGYLFPVSHVEPSEVGVYSYEFLWEKPRKSWEE